jgi:hypothetical protein
MLRFACALAMISTASAASATPWSAGLDEAGGYGGSMRELSYRWRLETGGSLRVGPWQASISIPLTPAIRSNDPARDTEQLFGFGVGARVGYHVAPSPHTDAYVTLGLGHEWMTGDQSVIRPCRLTGECLAGYTMDTPSYSGWVPELRLGIGPRYELPDAVLGGSFELIAQYHSLDIPPHGEHAFTVLAGLTLSVGWHPTKKRQNVRQNL